MDALLLPNSAGRNCISVTLAGLWVVVSMGGKRCHLHRAADSKDTSALLESRALHTHCQACGSRCFLKDLSTCIRPVSVMRGLGLWLGSWPKSRQRLLGWGEGRELRMGQLPLEEARMSLAAAVGVVRGLGVSP